MLLLKWNTLTFVVFLFLSSFEIQASDLCQKIFEDTKIESNETNAQSPSVYARVSQRVINRFESQFEKPEFRLFRDWYYSHFFFNRRQILLQNMADPTKFSPQPYNQNGEDAFLGYQIAREKTFAKSLDEVLSIEGISGVQRDLLKSHNEHETLVKFGRLSTSNSEHALDSNLGVMRDYPVIHLVKFGVAKGSFTLRGRKNDKSRIENILRMTHEQFLEEEGASIQQMNESSENPNPLQLTHLFGVKAQSPQTYEDLEIENPYIGRRYEYVEYAPIEKWLDYRSKLSKKLVAELRAAEEAGLFETTKKVAKDLRMRFAQELTEYETKQLKEKLKRYDGNEMELINAVADYYWNVISIHPFANGNGRTFRLVVERILAEIKLPPPIWTYMGEDAFRSLNEFRRILSDSIYISKWFHSFLLNEKINSADEARQKLFSLLMPPEILTAFFQKDKDQNFYTPVLSFQQFKEFTRLSYQAKPTAKYIDRYIEWIFRRDPSLQSEQGQLGLIPKAYIETFYRVSRNEEEHQQRKELFYTDQLIYRGAAQIGDLTADLAIRSFMQHTGMAFGNGVEAKSSQDLMRVFDIFNIRILGAPERAEKAMRSHIRGPIKSNQGFWSSMMSSWSSSPEEATASVEAKFTKTPVKGENNGYVVLIEALMPRYGAFRVNEIADQMSIPVKKSQGNEFVVVGSVLPEMIQKILFQKPRQKIGFWGKLFHSSSVETSESDIITVTRLDATTLLVSEVNSQHPFLGIKQYRVRIKPSGRSYEILD